MSMFLSIQPLSVGVLTNYYRMPIQSYSKVNLLGNNVFDGVHLRDYTLTEAEVEAIESVETFTSHTIMLANFENTLAAGNYISLEDQISKWIIKRKPVGEFAPITLATLDASETTFVDNLQGNRKEYEYLLVPVTEKGIIGSPVTATVTSDFYGWFLCSEDNKIIYKFDLDIASESIVSNNDIQIFENYTNFPVVRKGKRNYKTSTLTTIPYTLNGVEIVIDNKFLKEIEAFINNDNIKVLKNTAGDLFKVQTHDFSYQYKDQFQEQPYTITFSWTQVGDVE